MHLDRGLDWQEIAGVVETAHRTVSAKAPSSFSGGLPRFPLPRS